MFTQNLTKSVIDFLKSLLIILPIAFLIRTYGYGLYQVPSGSMEPTLLVGERLFADKLTIWFKPPKRGEIIAFNDPLYNYSDNIVLNLFQRYAWGPQNWTKRVIGIPGDHIEGKIENGNPEIYLNGQKIHETYLNKYPLIGVFKDIDRYSNEHTFDLKTFDSKLPFDKQPFYRINPDNIIRINGEALMRYPKTPLPDNKDIFDIKLGKNEYWVMGDNRLNSWDSRSWGKLDGKFIHGKIIWRIWSHDSKSDWWILDFLRHTIDFFKRMRWNRFFQKVN